MKKRNVEHEVGQKWSSVWEVNQLLAASDKVHVAESRKLVW